MKKNYNRYFSVLSVIVIIAGLAVLGACGADSTDNTTGILDGGLPPLMDTTTAAGTAAMTTTAAATTAAGSTATATAAAGAPATIDLSAQAMAFDTDMITVRAGEEVTINFENMDSVPHNFAAYMDSSASQEIYVGEVINGGESIEYTFTAPDEPGEYFFRCDVHPTIMTGILVVE